MTDGGVTSALRGSFAVAAESAKRAAAEHVQHAKSRRRFEQYVVLAIAALEQAAAQDDLEPADLRFVAAAAADAAAVCRTEEPSPAVTALTVELEHAARACDELLIGDAPTVPAEPWRRFLFDGLDVDVRRIGRRWRIRVGTVEKEAGTIDEAVSNLLPSAAAGRIGPIAFQILDWFERSAGGGGG